MDFLISKSKDEGKWVEGEKYAHITIILDLSLNILLIFDKYIFNLLWIAVFYFMIIINSFFARRNGIINVEFVLQ